MADDGELLQLWRDGERSAGSQLLSRHFSSLYQFFRNKINGEIDDLVQQTFLSCLEAQPSFRGDCSFRTFLFQIARRRLYDHYRDQTRRRDLSFESVTVRDLGTSPSGALRRKDATTAIRDALQELPVDMQMLLELSYWENMRVEELAQVFEIAPGTVKSRLFRARDRLKDKLAARGLCDDEAALHLARFGVGPFDAARLR